MVGVAQLVEPWIVIPVVVGSSPIVHPISPVYMLPFWSVPSDSVPADVVKLVDTLDLGSSGEGRESSSLSIRTI